MQQPSQINWYVITRYPVHPSPYFKELESGNHVRGFNFQFAEHLSDAASGPYSVINLHRLKRLYTTDGKPNVKSAFSTLNELTAMKARGSKVVWTVHNLFPIDSFCTSEVDSDFVIGLLELCDLLVCHTVADSVFFKSHNPDIPYIVCGWGGLSRKDEVPPHLQKFLDALSNSRPVFLLFGNMPSYKETWRIVSLFLKATKKARLVVVGPTHDFDLRNKLLRIQHESDRISVLLDRIPPEFAHSIYEVADCAICHYQSTGRFGFFKSVLYPSSVATAVSFGVPIVGPDLPSIREIARDSQALLYEDSDSGIIEKLQEAEWIFGHYDRGRKRASKDVSLQWASISHSYARALACLYSDSLGVCHLT